MFYNERTSSVEDKDRGPLTAINIIDGTWAMARFCYIDFIDEAGMRQLSNTGHYSLDNIVKSVSLWDLIRFYYENKDKT